MRVLGISAFYHDSSACIIDKGEIIAAAQEERFTREKHTAEFPTLSIKFCLEKVNCQLDEIDAIVFYDKPFLKFERLLETYLNSAPRGLASFLKAMPLWIKEKLFIKRIIQQKLETIGKIDLKRAKILFSNHHLSHAASAYFPSPFNKAAILTVDGVGEWTTCSIAIGESNKITTLKEMHFPDSIGLLYSAFTYYLGFKVNSGEYKLMGLAPFGQLNDQCNKFISQIKSELVTIFNDGSIKLNQVYFKYQTGLTMTDDDAWFKLFGFRRRKPEDEITQIHCNLAHAIQVITEEILLKLVNETKRVTGCEHLCLAGGVALNCVANGKIRSAGVFKEIYVQPASGDAGGALGAALAIHHIYNNHPKLNQDDAMQGAYLGPQFSNFEIISILNAIDASYQEIHTNEDLCQMIATYINQGYIVGWFQGRSEFGPRALGNRSIFADPTSITMQKQLNESIKFRESFRPFAPIMLEEEAIRYYNSPPSPYMLFTSNLIPEYRIAKEKNESKSIINEINQTRSKLPAITHVDYSSRIQTVNKSKQPLLSLLLESFKKLSGYGVLVNTSFNVRGEPIVNSPFDAYQCFMSTKMDILVLEQLILFKDNQPKKNFEKFKLQIQED